MIPQEVVMLIILVLSAYALLVMLVCTLKNCKIKWYPPVALQQREDN